MFNSLLQEVARVAVTIRDRLEDASTRRMRLRVGWHSVPDVDRCFLEGMQPRRSMVKKARSFSQEQCYCFSTSRLLPTPTLSTDEIILPITIATLATYAKMWLNGMLRRYHRRSTELFRRASRKPGYGQRNADPGKRSHRNMTLAARTLPVRNLRAISG